MTHTLDLATIRAKAACDSYGGDACARLAASVFAITDELEGLRAAARELLAANGAYVAAHEARTDAAADIDATPDSIRAAEDAHSRAVARRVVTRVALRAMVTP